jgi:DNA modification methylase
MNEILHNEILYNDYKELTDTILDKSVDLILIDPPYNVTQNDWDVPIDLSDMWKRIKRIIKPGAAVIITAQQPFTTDLIVSNRDMFRYDLIWIKKGKATGFLNANRMPLRSHEHILVFYDSLPTYNPQKSVGSVNHSKGSHHRGKKQTNNNYGKFNQEFQSSPTNDKFPISVVEFKSVHPPVHPTQKPVALFEYLIKTYSNEGNLVVDFFGGSGTTAIASHNLKRNFICGENKLEYFLSSKERYNKHIQQYRMELNNV